MRFLGLKTKCFAAPQLAFSAALTLMMVSILGISPFGDFPLNDDWVHAKTVLQSLSDGTIKYCGIERAWYFPQLLIGLLSTKFLGFSHSLLRAVGFLFGVATLVMLYRAIKTITLDPLIIFCSLFSFIFFTPIFILLPTFMTDIPFLFFWITTCYLAERGLKNNDKFALFIAAGFSALCILQRHNGLVLPIAFVALSVWRRSVLIFALSLPQFAVFYLFQQWWTSFPHVVSDATSLSSFSVPKQFFSDAYIFLMYLGLSVFPLSILVLSQARESLRKRLPIIALTLLISYTIFLGFNGQRMPYLGNQLSKLGVFSLNEIIYGERPKIIGRYLSWMITFCSLLGLSSLVICLSELWKKWLKKDYQFGLFSLIATFGYVLSILIRGIAFDRYFIVAVPFVLIVLVIWLNSKNSHPTRLTLQLTMLSIFLTACFSFSICFDYFRWNEAKWKAAQHAVGEGYKPPEINGGYEWQGWFNGLINHQLLPLSSYKRIVSFSPLPEYQTKAQFDYYSIWPSDGKIYLLGKD